MRSAKREKLLRELLVAGVLEARIKGGCLGSLTRSIKAEAEL
jgi:hypothetical protein